MTRCYPLQEHVFQSLDTAVSGVQYFGREHGRERASTNYFLFLTHEHFLFKLGRDVTA